MSEAPRKPYRRHSHHGRHAVRALRHFFLIGAGVFFCGSVLSVVSALFRHSSERMPFWRMGFWFLAASLASLLIYSLFKAARDWRHSKAHTRHHSAE
jgi:hypothetical protein